MFTEPIQARPTGRDLVAASRTAAPANWEPVTRYSGHLNQLGVHNTIVAHESGTTADQSTNGDTPYIRRDHDFRLRSLITHGVASEARPLMVTLVGSSASGKTRALFEAVLATLPDWPLLLPGSARDLTAILRDGVPGGSIIWLDELQNYLSGPGSGDVVDGLNALLGAPSSPCFLVVASIWPSTKERLLASERAILHGNGPIAALFQSRMTLLPVERDFSSALVEEVRTAEVRDPRVREAVLTSGGPHGTLTQTLAGGRLLLARYRRSHDSDAPVFSIAASTVLKAAIDICFFAGSGPIPRRMLEGVLPAYLDNPESRVQEPTWFDSALCEAAQEERGIRALTPLRMDASAGAADAYELHEYLQQFGYQRAADMLRSRERWDRVMEHLVRGFSSEMLANGPAYSRQLAASLNGYENTVIAEVAKALGRERRLPILEVFASSSDSPSATFEFVDLLAELGEFDKLKHLSDESNLASYYLQVLGKHPTLPLLAGRKAEPNTFVVIDDHQLFNEALTLHLGDAHGLRSVGSFGSVEEYLLSPVAARLVVIDLNRPEFLRGDRGVRTMARLGSSLMVFSGMPILTSEDEFRSDLLGLGASAFVSKNRVLSIDEEIRSFNLSAPVVD